MGKYMVHHFSEIQDDSLGCVPAVNGAAFQTSIQLLGVTWGSIGCGYRGVRKFLGRKKCVAKQRKRIIIAIPVAVLREKRIANV